MTEEELKAAVEFWSTGPGAKLMERLPVEWEESEWFPSVQRVAGAVGGKFRWRLRWEPNVWCSTQQDSSPGPMPPGTSFPGTVAIPKTGGFIVESLRTPADCWARREGTACCTTSIHFIHGHYLDKLREKFGHDLDINFQPDRVRIAAWQARAERMNGCFQVWNARAESLHEAIFQAMNKAFPEKNDD